MDSLPINLADLIVIIVLIVSGIFAFVRGFVHEVFAIGSWIAATFVTLYAFPHAQPLVEQYIPTEFFASLVTGVVIFLVSLVLFSMLTRLLSNRVQESSLGALDRSLGLLFGFARGAVIVVLAWLALTFLMPEEDMFEWVKDARSRPMVEWGADRLMILVPAGMLERGSEAAEEARRRAEELRRQEQTYRQLVSPLRKADAPESQPEYNENMRGEIEKAIEGLIGEEPAPEGNKQ
ncbi:CvpA family protein [Pelagibius litoralis]|uniref:CvpA family protein n=1 Tax=Pelagibius litoralis TaxID=374515 RepID=A0A967EZM1_9PROT|nr:CvpA family protein [Pelagibius litoralis]NIA70314.1 CvpA family protein [Pelagibius litoralis]